MTGDLDQHPAALTRIADLLWPAATHDRAIVTGRHDAGEIDYLVVPSAARPRLLVPRGATAARTAVMHSSTDASRRARALRHLVAATAGTGLHRVLPLPRLLVRPSTDVASSLLDHIAAATGLPITWLSVRLGSARPNQKPVILLGSDSSPLPTAFAKVGWNPLTRGLVAHEAATLAGGNVPRGDGVRAPHVHLHDTWQDHELLVIEALPVPATSTAVTPSRVLDVIGEIATAHPGATTSLDAWIVDQLAPRLASHDGRDGHGRLRAVVDRLQASWGTSRLRTGAWHGDFRPWNMADDGDAVLLWDWERHALDRPLGLDAVHLHFPIPSADEDPVAYRARADDGAAATAPILAGLGVAAELLPLLRALHATELVLREFEDVAVQPDVARPRHLDHLLTYLESLS